MELRSVQLSATILDAGAIFTAFRTLPGNQPAKHENWIGVWSGAMIAAGQPPLRKVLIATENSVGEQILDGLSLQRKPYIVGYCPGPAQESVCATVQFTPDETPAGEPGVPFQSQIRLLAYTARDLLVQFETPPGNIPVENKNWLGLWPGAVAAFDGVNLLHRTWIDRRANEDSQVMSGVALAYDTTYTIGLGTHESINSIAATITFQTGESVP
jgi:hypothetical protein